MPIRATSRTDLQSHNMAAEGSFFQTYKKKRPSASAFFEP